MALTHVTPLKQSPNAMSCHVICCSQVLEGFSGWRRRWTIVVLCFVAFMLCNMDRVNMSVAILPMSQQYNWNSATVGLVQSSFFW